MAVDNILRTYGDASIKEDVLSLVETLTATENWFLTNLGKTTAINTVHSTLVDTLRTPASAAVGEAEDYTALARTTPTRLTNIVEHIAIPFKVSRTAQAVERYTGENELTRQTTKALKDWSNAAEFDLLRSTLVSGASGYVPKMSGILQAISKSNTYTAHTSGTVFSASILKGLMMNNWNNSNGEVVTDLFLGSYLKNVLDGFTAGSTKYVMASDKEVVDSVDIYDGGGFGRVRVHVHRYLWQAGDGTGRVLGLRPEKLKIAYLETPYIDKDLARSGPYDFYAVAGSLTLEVRNQDTHFYATGFYRG